MVFEMNEAPQYNEELWKKIRDKAMQQDVSNEENKKIEDENKKIEERNSQRLKEAFVKLSDEQKAEFLKTPDDEKQDYITFWIEGFEFEKIKHPISLGVQGVKEVQGWMLDETKETIWQAFYSKGRFVPQRLGERILNETLFITLRSSNEIYIWQNGYYQPKAETFIKERCNELLGIKVSTYSVNETIEYIKRDTYYDIVEPPPNLINVANGVLDIDTMILQTHEACPHRFFQIIPVNYNPDAKCPKITKFLREITGNEEDATTLEEFSGYCLYRKIPPPIQKSLLLVGEKSMNGKTIYCLLIGSFLGKNNVSAESLQGLVSNKFAVASIFGKLANINPEIPAQALTQTEKFKQIVGGDLVGAEKKYYDSFTFHPYTKLLFACNQVPAVPENESIAYYRRLVLIRCPNVFEGINDDKHLIDKLTTPEELSGFLNVVIQRLRCLLANGDFSHKRTKEQTKQEYGRMSEPTTSFVESCFIRGGSEQVIKETIYDVFIKFCNKFDLPILSERAFWMKIVEYNTKHHLFVESRLSKTDNKRVLMGISLKPNLETIKLEEFNNEQ